VASYRTSGSTWTTTAGAKAVAIDALAGDQLVALTGHSAITTSHVVTDDAGGTWVQVCAGTSAAGVNSHAIWIRTTRVNNTSTVTVTTTPSSSTGGGLVVVAVQGMYRFGLAAVRSFGVQSDQAATTPAPVLSLTPLASSVIVGWIMDETFGSANCVPRSSPAYTERSDSGYNSPATGQESMTLNSGETSATITWGGATPSAFGSAVIELDATDPSIYKTPLPGIRFISFSTGGPPVLGRQVFPTNAAVNITLVVDDTTHSHSADSVLLSQVHELNLQNVEHAHSADNLALTQVHSLALANATHSHTADNVALTQVHSLVVQNASHGHTAGSVALEQTHILTVQGAAHAHAAENFALTQIHNLAVANAQHSHTADNLTITQVHSITIQAAIHGHTAENIVLGTGDSIELAIQSANHAHAAGSLVLTQAHSITVAGGVYSHLAQNVNLTFRLNVIYVSSEARGVTIPPEVRST